MPIFSLQSIFFFGVIFTEAMLTNNHIRVNSTKIYPHLMRDQCTPLLLSVAKFYHDKYKVAIFRLIGPRKRYLLQCDQLNMAVFFKCTLLYTCILGKSLFTWYQKNKAMFNWSPSMIMHTQKIGIFFPFKIRMS